MNSKCGTQRASRRRIRRVGRVFSRVAKLAEPLPVKLGSP